jgi:hypothetical protein
MSSNKATHRHSDTTDAPSASNAAIERMRAAVNKAVKTGTRFLRGEVDADEMAKTMIGAVNDYMEQERTAGSGSVPSDREAQELQGALRELMGCGSGYLAGRCDVACVARTMTEMVREFPIH